MARYTKAAKGASAIVGEGERGNLVRVCQYHVQCTVPNTYNPGRNHI